MTFSTASTTFGTAEMHLVVSRYPPACQATVAGPEFQLTTCQIEKAPDALSTRRHIYRDCLFRTADAGHFGFRQILGIACRGRQRQASRDQPDLDAPVLCFVGVGFRA